jgi:hypothetical protein
VDCIIDVEEGKGVRVVRLAGRLAEAQVPDLLRVCAEQAQIHEMNLRDLVSVDAVGLTALHRLRDRIALVDVPIYIALKLEALAKNASVR